MKLGQESTGRHAMGRSVEAQMRSLAVLQALVCNLGVKTGHCIVMMMVAAQGFLLVCLIPMRCSERFLFHHVLPLLHQCNGLFMSSSSFLLSS